MKPLSELTVCQVDYGTFLGLANRIGKEVKRHIYYSPFEEEYLDVNKCVIGRGFDNFERCDEPMDPKIFKEIDLFVFPDIGFGGWQRYLRSVGKLVWGSMGASDLELYRTRFLKVLEEVGLPMVHAEVIRGLSALAEHLKEVENKWVKVNRYRANMETWKHFDWLSSQRTLEDLAKKFGGYKEQIVFVVQDEIKGDDDEPVLEIGFDGFSVDGDFPDDTYQGYEAKNQLYLGSLRKGKQIPAAIRYVNQKMAPVLASHGYRNFWATEIRQHKGIPNFIDPTARLAGQTMEHQFRNCRNLVQLIYEGAQGRLIQPVFENPYAAEATVHYKGEGQDVWKSFILPDELKEWMHLYHCCHLGDGEYQFPAGRNDEIGVLCGEGKSVRAAIDNLKENFALIEDKPVKIELSGFAELIEQIESAEAEGLKFSEQPLPEPTIALS